MAVCWLELVDGSLACPACFTRHSASSAADSCCAGSFYAAAMQVLRGRSNAQRLTVSLTESLGFRAMVKPVTLPLKIVLSWKLIVGFKKKSAVS